MKSEPGVCFECGKETSGTPAKADWLIFGARRFRALLSLPKKHTVACSGCMPKLIEKRKIFEKRLHWCKIGAVAFALLVLAGAAATDSIGPQALFGAIVGAIFVISLAFLSYCPSFQMVK